MQSRSFLSRRIDRRRLLIATAAVISAPSIAIAIPNASAREALVVTMVTDTAGIGDQSFTDLATAGADRAVEELGIELNVLESKTATDFVKNLSKGAEQGDITIAVGFLLDDALADVAPQFPDHHFVILDTVIEGDNIVSYVFREQEGAFLAGVLAASISQTGLIGFMGGIRIPPVIRQEVGYVAGARSINPDIKVLIAYADDFEDPDLGKELANAQYTNGADIILSAAGRTGIGAFDAAREQGEGVYVIATDQDQSQLGAEFQLASVIKRLDTVVFDAIESAQNDTFTAGIHEFGIAEDGVGLSAFNDIVPQDVKDIVNTYKTAIVDGTLVPPADDDALETFEPIPPDQIHGTATPAT